MAALPRNRIHRHAEKRGGRGIGPLDKPCARIHDHDPSADPVEHFTPEMGRGDHSLPPGSVTNVKIAPLPRAVDECTCTINGI
jgi:hypothetical protein